MSNIGKSVRVTGFKVPSGFDDMQYAHNEKEHIKGYVGKIGTVIHEDNDALHPIHVEFDNMRPSVCRFSTSELETVEKG
jgi:hypothetical protein